MTNSSDSAQQGWMVCLAISIVGSMVVVLPTSVVLYLNWDEWFGVHNQINTGPKTHHYKLDYPTHLAPRGDTIDHYRKADGKFASVSDPYRFLEDPDSDQTKAWVAAQRELTNSYLQNCSVREKFKEAMTECFNFPKMGLMHKYGDYYYYNYNSGLQNQALYYRVKEKNTWQINMDDPVSDSEVFLDPNQLSQEGIASLGTSSWSEDGRYYAYAIKMGGSDWSTIHVRDASKNEDLLKDVMKWVKFSSIAWTHDNKGFFYSRFDNPEVNNLDQAAQNTQKLEYQKVYYHFVGTYQSDDILIFQNQQQPNWMFITEVTNDGKYLLIYTTKDTDDIQLINAAEIGDGIKRYEENHIEFKSIVSEWIGGFQYIHNNGPYFYFKTNYEAPKGRVIMISYRIPQTVNWQQVIAESPKDTLQHTICANGLLLNTYLENAYERVEIYKIGNESNYVEYLRDIQLPDMGSVGGLVAKWDSDELFYSFGSFTDPGSSYMVNMTTFEQQKIRTTKLAASCPDPSDFVTDQVWYKSKDGTEVPMFIVRKRSVLPNLDRTPEQPLPTILYAYGGFGIPSTPFFSVSNLLFMGRMDGIFALANIRGGGEFGEEWHKASVKEKKQNGFDDFISAAEYLQENKYTDNSHLVIKGGSNGGLLVTAVANQRQDLFAGVIGQVPVTDMMRFQNFTIGWAWASEYGSTDEGGYDYLIKYSPLHTIKPRKYPAMLITTADHDDRVVPLHTYKYIATLQYKCARVPGQAPLLARIDHNAGHGGGKPINKVIDELADTFGFIAQVTDAEWGQDAQHNDL